GKQKERSLFFHFEMASANATYGQKESSDQNFDYMFKILIIGNSSVGKTSFLFRYADDSFTPAFVSTVGIDFKVKTIYRNDKRIKLQIWSCWEAGSYLQQSLVERQGTPWTRHQFITGQHRDTQEK
ncbi:Ras- protein Rab-3A, partial [Ilyodon furcidens]